MIYFYLTIRAKCSKLRGADMGDGDVIQGGSEGCEVFFEEMTVQIRARDRERLSSPDANWESCFATGRAWL